MDIENFDLYGEGCRQRLSPKINVFLLHIINNRSNYKLRIV